MSTRAFRLILMVGVLLVVGLVALEEFPDPKNLANWSSEALYERYQAVKQKCFTLEPVDQIDRGRSCEDYATIGQELGARKFSRL